MTTNKYPNADTSPERLAEIETNHRTPGGEMAFSPKSYEIRDLLAMLQERSQLQCLSCFELKGNIYCKECVQKAMSLSDDWAKELIELRQQLHDQRWRRVDEEIPYNELIELVVRSKCRLPLGEEFHEFDEIFLGKRRKDDLFHGPQGMTIDLIKAIWWRPIPPLPPETKEDM